MLIIASSTHLEVLMMDLTNGLLENVMKMRIYAKMTKMIYSVFYI